MVKDIIKWGILAIIVLISAINDKKTRKIPNKLLIIGFMGGIVYNLIFGSLSALDWLGRFGFVIFLFFFGMLRWMGLGDIKLLMVITMFLGFKYCLYIFIAASFGMVIVHIFNKEDRRVMILTLNQIFMRLKLVMMEQKSYPFAPYLFFGTLCIGIAKGFGLV